LSAPLISPLFPYTTLFRSRSFAAQLIPSRYQVASANASLLPFFRIIFPDLCIEHGGLAKWLFVNDPVHQPVGLFPASGPLQQQRSEEHTSELQSRFDLVCR